MKRTVFYLTLGILILNGLTGTFAEENRNHPKRLKRSESFLGVHFDFHAGDDCTEIGKNVDREMIEYIIDQVKPREQLLSDYWSVIQEVTGDRCLLERTGLPGTELIITTLRSLRVYISAGSKQGTKHRPARWCFRNSDA